MYKKNVIERKDLTKEEEISLKKLIINEKIDGYYTPISWYKKENHLIIK